MKKITALIITFVLAIGLFEATTRPFPVKAATSPASKSAATSTASPSASPEETTLELKKRIEKVVEEKRDQIRGVINNLLSDKYGFIGEVTRLSQEALTIKQNGDSRILPFTEKTIVIRKGKRITPAEIEVGNWVTILGSGTNEKFSPEILIVSATSLKPTPKTIMIGTITKIAKTSITILPRGGQGEETLQLTKTTKFENFDGGAIKVTDLDKDISILTISTRNEGNQLELSTARALTDVRATQNER